MQLEGWRSVPRRASLLGIAVGVCLPAAALLRVEWSAGPVLRWAVAPRSLPPGGWPGSWSEAARTAAELQGAAFSRMLALLCGLALLAWFAALAGTVLASLRRIAIERTEWALRSAVGATRRQIRREAAREGARVALVACVLGGVIAAPLSELLVRALPSGVEATGPGLTMLASSPLVPALLLLTVLAVTATPLLLLPRAADLRRPVAAGLAGGGSTNRGGGSDLVRFLAVCQLAVCIGIAACATLLLGGAPAVDDTLSSYPHARDTLVLRMRLPAEMTTNPQRRRAWDAVRVAAESVADVRAAALSTPGATLGFGIVDGGGAHCPGCGGAGMAAPVTFGRARHMAIDPNFFEVLGFELEPVGVDARWDGADGPAAGVVIDRELHRRWFQGTDVAGRRVWLRGTRPLDGPGHPVVGLADAPRPAGLRAERMPIPAVYLPLASYPPVEADLAVRTGAAVAHESLTGVVTRAVLAAAPEARVEVLGRLDRLLAAGMAPVRWLAAAAVVLAGIAFALALVGSSGAMAEHVRVRRAEIGLRRAVGARRGDVVRLLLVDTGRLIVVGSFVGSALAASASRGLPVFVEGLEALRPEVVGGLSAIVAIVGLVAAAVAVVRTTRLDPVEALRD